MGSLLSLAINIFSIVCMWFIFEKAGEPGWQSIIPVYNMYVLAKIAKKQWTFWVQLAAGVLFYVGIILCAVLAVGNLASYENYDTYDSYDDYGYYDEYDDYGYYDDYDYYSDDYYNDYNDDAQDMSHTTNKAAVKNLTSMRYDAHSDEEILDEFFGEMSLAIILMIVVMFLCMAPLFVSIFIQYMGLAKEFGLHWAFAFLLFFIKPVGMGIIAFSPEIKYQGGDGFVAPPAGSYSPAFATAQSQTPTQPMDGSYRPVEPINTNYHSPEYQSTDYNPYEPVSQARVAPDVSEMPLRQQDTIPQVKHRCPNCGFESDRGPNPDTFCPNCGYLYRG